MKAEEPVFVASPSQAMIGRLGEGCASAASGHAADALPKSVMNSRRFMSAPKHRRGHLYELKRVL